MRTRIRLKLTRIEGKKIARERFDVCKLQSEEIRRRYVIEVRNRFEALGDIEDPEEEHDLILATYREAAKKVIGRSKKQSKPWIGDKTWEKIKDRKEAKLKMEGARSERLKQRRREEYDAKDKEVKRSAREDKRNWIEKRAAAAEKAAENGRNKELYSITKTIAGERRRQEVGVKDKQGVLKTEMQERLQRWVEHLSEILNRDDPVNPVEEDEIEEPEEIGEIDLGRWQLQEVKDALKGTKPGKAPGVDEVGPELLRADMEDTAHRLTRCYNRLWETERWPEMWKKGLIVKIFKKGDLRDCNNWRGVTLLPVISKIFCRMLLERIKRGVDKELRKEQAGFRSKKSTTEQIFILRNILEQANEWRVGLYVHFVDFEKAFDSVHRESLWNIMKSYGIPHKMVRVIAGIYQGFECAVVDGSETSEWFKIKSGVKQGCVMSGFLFLLALDWTMREATADKRRGIRWNFTTVLEDLDFADDIALLSSKISDLKEKTGRLAEEAARVGLKLNARKCKTLRTGFAHSSEDVVVNGEEVEDVEEFVYLGATVNKEGGGSRDITNRLQKARGAFQRLGKVWATRGIGRRTKIRLFKTLVRPVLLYGCETWKIIKADERKLNSFQCQCLRRILRIRWQQRITNKRVVEMAEVNDISCEVRRRRWNWLGHILRREGSNDCFTALGWIPEGRRARGRPKTTWRRTVEKERNKAGWKSWEVAKAVARNRECWSESVTALCAYWRDKN